MKIRMFAYLIIVTLLSGCASSRMSDAEYYVEKEDYAKAIKAYLSQIEPHLKDGRAMVYYDRDVVTGLGEVYWLMQKYETALQILRRVVTKDPFFGKAQYYLGLSYEGLGEDDKAIDAYKNYPKIPASDPYRYVMAGRLDWMIRKFIIRDVQKVLQDESAYSWDSILENTIGVLYFDSQSEDPQWAPLQKGLAEMLATDLAQSGELNIVERMRINYLMEELRLSVSGMMQDEEQLRVGKFVGAKTLIKGSYMILPNMKMTLDAGIFNSQSSTFPRPSSYEGSLGRLFQIEKQLAFEIFEYFGVDLPLEAREEILKIPTKDMEAFMNYCMGLDALDRMNFAESQEFFHKALAIDQNFQLAKDRLIPQKVWDMTHNRNLVRLQHDVSQFVRKIPRGGPERLIQPESGLVGAWNRLMKLSAYQGAGFLPGNETRKGFQEADDKGARLLPTTLGVPPTPIR
ncbi:tetratricopeptide repeat protein [bacterium]|nr:tetratricopeptide repeat protein [bacterium]